ncbi:MAG: hypothetical protein ACPGXK_00135 [Phycisphaerae bacterium]
MKLLVKKGTTNYTVAIFIQDSSVTDGSGLTGLTFNSSGLICRYWREGAASAALSLVTQTVTGAHADGGFVAVDGTNMPGLYRLDLSDAILATGVGKVVVMLRGASNMAPVLLEIQLVDFDPNDTVRMGLTSLPNAVAGAAGGLANDTDANGRVRVVSGASAGEIALASGKVDVGNWNGSAVTNGVGNRPAVDAEAISGSTAAADLLEGQVAQLLNISSIKAKTDSLTFTTTNKVDCRVDNVAGTVVTGPNDFKADVSGTATQAAVAAIDTLVAAIKTKTDQLGFTTPGKVDARMDNVAGTAVSGPDDLKADVSNLSTQVSVNALDTLINAIKAKTDQLTFSTSNKLDSRVDFVGAVAVTTPNDMKANTASLATQATVNALNVLVELVRAKTDLLNFSGSDVQATLGSEEVTVGSMSTGALAQFANEDTGETGSVAGSVAALAQGSGGGVTVSDVTQAALAKFVTQDTGQSSAASGSVAKLAQATGGVGGGGETTIVLGPVVASKDPGNRVGAPATLEMFQGSAKTFTLSVLDTAGQAIDLSAFSLRFVVHDENDPTALVFEVTSGFALSDNNTVATFTVPASASVNANKNLNWKLWDYDGDVLSHGSFRILPAATATS